MEATNVAPQVCGIHVQFPATREETRVKATKYTMNSASNGPIFRNWAPKAVKGCGEASRDTGLAMRRSRMGARTSIEDREIWTRKDSARREADARPVTRTR